MKIKFYEDVDAFEVSEKDLELMKEDSLVMCEKLGEDYNSEKTKVMVGKFIKQKVLRIIYLSDDIYLLDTEGIIDPMLRINLRNQGFNFFWGNDFINNNKVEEGEL